MSIPLHLSVVIPVLDEAESLEQLYSELTAVLESLHRSYEIIFIDDGSKDGSVSLLRQLVENDSHVTLVELRRRFGKAAALQAGFKQVRGEVVVTMDADLQDCPSEIPKLLAKLEEGYDLVSGWKENRKDPIGKTLPSKFFNWVTSRTSGLELHDFNCGFKIYRREVTDNLDLYGELYRFIPVVAHAKGYSVTEISVTHRPRIFGRSKFGLERYLRGAFDLFTTLFLVGFRSRPLHLFGPIGVTVGGLGLAINLYLVVLWFGGQGIGDRPLLMLGTLLIGLGFQVLVLGLLAEMIVATSYRSTEVDGLIRCISRREDDKPIPRRVI